MNTIMRKSAGTIRIAFGLWALTACGAAFAQAFPSKPLRWIVPYAPGGGTDTVTRAIAPQMQASLGQPIVIENRPSATGFIGIETVAKAGPDGYTLLTAGNELVLMKLLYRKLSFDPVRDLTPVSLMARVPIGLFLHESVPTKSLKEFVGYIKEHPGKLNFGSPGIGHGFHMAVEMFLYNTGTKMLHVPYKGTALVMQDLFAGRIQAIMYPPTAQLMDQVRKGVLRVVAAGRGQRLSHLPDVPTFDEGGVANFNADGFLVVTARTGSPKEVLERLSREIAKAVASPELSKALGALSMVPQSTSPEESRQFMNRELDSWDKVVKALALTLD